VNTHKPSPISVLNGRLVLLVMQMRLPLAVQAAHRRSAQNRHALRQTRLVDIEAWVVVREAIVLRVVLRDGM
jgi:hypothetical protein